MKSVRENTRQSTRKRGVDVDALGGEDAIELASPPPESAGSRPDADSAAEATQAWSYEVASPEASSDLTPVVGANLRRLRAKRGLSLERLARASGVSRAMLGQIELGQSTPTINVLW
ncbi:MAG: helix-turn-helix transcriptional regulator, partial [Byssovorax sp.]